MCIMVFAPHPDDEVLIAAGIIKRALDNRDEIIVVNVTNGDRKGRESGYIRIAEAMEAAAILGLNPKQHIFLGYGDGTLWKLYHISSDMQTVPSSAGNETYGLPIAALDFHSRIYGEPGSYNRVTLLSDIEMLLQIYKPSRIYTTSSYDRHSDHSALNMFITQAIINAKTRNASYNPLLYETIVWAPGGNSEWPIRDSDPDPLSSFTPPPGIENTPLDWKKVQLVPVPDSMQIVPRANNLKYKAIQAHKSQKHPILDAFVKKDEFFWVLPL